MTSGEVGSPETSNTNSSTISTPNNNNYAAPHTPIASAKRPRAAANRSSASRSGSQLNGISERNHSQSSGNGACTPVRRFKMADAGSEQYAEDGEFSSAGIDAMSPMHPPKPVVDHSREPISVNALESNLGDEIDNDGSTETGNSTWVGIFSPVLNFLKSNEDDVVEEKIKLSPSKPVDIDGDGDVTMADHAANANHEA